MHACRQPTRGRVPSISRRQMQGCKGQAQRLGTPRHAGLLQGAAQHPPRKVATTGAVVTERCMMEKRRVGHSRRWYSAGERRGWQDPLHGVQTPVPHGSVAPRGKAAWCSAYSMLHCYLSSSCAAQTSFPAGRAQEASAEHGQGRPWPGQGVPHSRCSLQPLQRLRPRLTSQTPQIVPSTSPRNMPRMPLCAPACKGLAAGGVAAALVPLQLAAASIAACVGLYALPYFL